MTQQEWNSRKIRETQQIKDLGLTEKAKGGNYNQREKKMEIQLRLWKCNMLISNYESWDLN